MTTMGLPKQTDFLTSLGFTCDEKARKPRPEPSEVTTRNLALIISNLKASRPTNEPRASSQVANIERMARKTRAAMSLRYQLLATEVDRGETYNPLETIRNRAANNFQIKEGVWMVTNDEMLHDISYRRGCERLPTQSPPRSPGPYQCRHESRHGSQFLISRLQEKHTSSGANSTTTPQIVVSGPDSHTTYSSPRSGSRSEAPSSEPSEEELEFSSTQFVPISSSSVGTSKSNLSHDNFLNDFSILPSDKHLECASTELEYMSCVLEAALRQQKTWKAPLSRRFCHIYTKTLQEDVIPKHLDHLARSERCATEMYQEIEKSIVNPTESLKLESDRMIADISTTLNLQLRDCATMITELERCGHADCLMQLGYFALEWSVRILLRFIWVIVSVWRLVRWILTLVGILSPPKRKAALCANPTPLPSPHIPHLSSSVSWSSPARN